MARKRWNGKPGNAADISEYLFKIANAVLNGDLDPRKANSAGYLIGAALSAIRIHEQEEKIAELTEKLSEMQEIYDKLLNTEK